MTRFIEVTSANNGRKFFLPINDFFHCYSSISEHEDYVYGTCFIEYLACVGYQRDYTTQSKSGAVFSIKESFEEVQLLIKKAQKPWYNLLK